ncbi:PF04448 family protein [Providencia alcalifaciens R90-1475]|nr:PF04448 family protein [Providencia alcalifaciens R90-1475]
MPEKDVRVMAVWNGMPTILCLFSRTGLWDDGDFYSCIPLEDVTHWMPLPPMPEGE